MSGLSSCLLLGLENIINLCWKSTYGVLKDISKTCNTSHSAVGKISNNFIEHNLKLSTFFSPQISDEAVFLL